MSDGPMPPREPGPFERDAPAPRSQGHWVPPAFHWPAISDADMATIRARQRGKAIALALLLGALVVLIFFISIVRIHQGAGK